MDPKILNALTKNTTEIEKVEAKINSLIVNEKKKLDTLRQRDANLREALKDAMETSGVHSYATEKLSISYTPAGTRTILDTTKLKAEQPELVAKYTKASNYKASVRIIVKEVKNGLLQ